MTNRLEFFRQQMAAFEGTSDPQKAIERGYYIEQPRNSLASNIAAKISLRPTSRHLLIGGIGSGKTTQLLMIRDRINQIEDFYAHYVDVSLYTNISEIQPGSLLLVISLILCEMFNNFPKMQYYKEIIEHYQELPYNYQKIYTNLQDIYNDIIGPDFYYGFCILFDGLDRCTNNQSLLATVQNDINLISKLDIGLVLVSSIALAYSNIIVETFNHHIDNQPCFDVQNDREAYTFFNNILNARSCLCPDFISRSAQELLIIYSGGVLRDLINLTQNSIEEAYLSDSDTVQEDHVKQAFISFSQTKILGISDSQLETLERVADTQKFAPRTNEDIYLLVNQKILEYHYPKKRYAVHPALLPLIDKTLA